MENQQELELNLEDVPVSVIEEPKFEEVVLPQPEIPNIELPKDFDEIVLPVDSFVENSIKEIENEIKLQRDRAKNIDIERDAAFDRVYKALSSLGISDEDLAQVLNVESAEARAKKRG